MESFWQDLAHWDEVSDRIQVGDSLESAIEKTTNEMKLLQAHTHTHEFSKVP